MSVTNSLDSLTSAQANANISTYTKADDTSALAKKIIKHFRQMDFYHRVNISDHVLSWRPDEDSGKWSLYIVDPVDNWTHVLSASAKIRSEITSEHFCELIKECIRVYDI